MISWISRTLFRWEASFKYHVPPWPISQDVNILWDSRVSLVLHDLCWKLYNDKLNWQCFPSNISRLMRSFSYSDNSIQTMITSDQGGRWKHLRKPEEQWMRCYCKEQEWGLSYSFCHMHLEQSSRSALLSLVPGFWIMRGLLRVHS